MTPLSFDYPISVAILGYWSRGSDGDDTRETIQAITQALEKKGHKVRVAQVRKNDWRRQLQTPGEVVFNLVEDDTWELYFKVGHKLCEIGRPVVGMDAKSLTYSTDKIKMSKRLKSEGVSVPDSKIYQRGDKISKVRSMNYPLIVKPAGEHSGWGISQDSVVIDEKELSERVEYLFNKFSGDVIAEEFIDGREIHVTVIGHGKHLAILPYIEIDYKGEFENNWPIYSYDAKWTETTWEYWDSQERLSLSLGKELDMKVHKLVKKAFRAGNCQDIVRLDLRIDEKGKPYVVDVNMSPSINPVRQSPTVRSAMALGWSYEDLIETLVAITYTRCYGRLPDRMRERRLLLSMPAKVG